MDSWYKLVVLCILILLLCHRINGSGCQHQCDCGFHLADGDVQDEDVTLRYEVFGGLTGAFSPLLVAGLAYLMYKRCCSSSVSPSLGGPLSSRGAPWDEANSRSGNRGRAWSNPTQSGGNSGRSPLVSTPTSLYGETDNEMTKSSLPYSPGQNSTPGSKWVNIHKNVQDDKTNIWFKNVNKVRQFY